MPFMLFVGVVDIAYFNEIHSILYATGNFLSTFPSMQLQPLV